MGTWSIGIDLKGFGKRLKEERERLEMSQIQFAQLCGVGRTAQFNYEREEREPSYTYMDMAEKLGVDALYVFTGTRTGKDWAYARAYSKLLFTIEMFLGLEEGLLEQLCKDCVALDEKLMQSQGEPKAGGAIDFAAWQLAVIAWLGTSTKVDKCVDPALLARLLDAVKQSASKFGLTLSTEKLLRAALMLYPDAKPQKGKRFPAPLPDGLVSQDMIDKITRLAAA